VLCIDGSLHSYGTGSLFDVIARAAGARNLAAEHGVGPFRKLDIEEVLAWRPDALVLQVQADHAGGRPSWLEQYVGLARLPCVQRGRFMTVPFPQLSTTSHRLVETVDLLQRQLRAWGKP
jgi:ABC-type hemin transport system substrate-binding protein